MQFIVSSNQLLRQLQTLSGVLSNSNTLPILDHFLFELAPGELVMTASDLETTMSSKMEVRTEDTGAIAVPARMLLDILKAFPDIPLTLKVDGATHEGVLLPVVGRVHLKAGPHEVNGCGKDCDQRCGAERDDLRVAHGHDHRRARLQLEILVANSLSMIW